jgi:hypothetical protein
LYIATTCFGAIIWPSSGCWQQLFLNIQQPQLAYIYCCIGRAQCVLSFAYLLHVSALLSVHLQGVVTCTILHYWYHSIQHVRWLWHTSFLCVWKKFCCQMAEDGQIITPETWSSCVQDSTHKFLVFHECSTRSFTLRKEVGTVQKAVLCQLDRSPSSNWAAPRYGRHVSAVT